MIDTLLADARVALIPARILVALWMILSAAQWIAVGRSPAVFGRGSGVSRRWLRGFFAAQIAVAVVLVAATPLPVTIACLALLLASHLALTVATGVFWADGSDKIGTIALAGTLLTAIGVAAGDAGLALAGVLLAGGQLAICYLVAGLSKLPAQSWRDGTELAAVMATRAWGHPHAARLLRRHRPLALAASWGVIGAEAGFPLALLAPEPWLIAALGVLFAFHLATAVLMGLNRFPWAFAATYPAVLLLGRVVRHAIG